MKFEIEHKNKLYDCEWIEDINLDKIKELTQASGFIFDESGKLCIINATKDQSWCIPGGRIEEIDETPLTAFIRETIEEADLELKDIQQLGVFKTIPKDNPKDVRHSVRFVARVAKINPQTIDPAHGIIPKRKFIDPSEFANYVKWGENGIFQLKKALEKLK